MLGVIMVVSIGQLWVASSWPFRARAVLVSIESEMSAFSCGRASTRRSAHARSRRTRLRS